MRLLSTFFPKRPRPRTVVHAGPLVLERAGGVRALTRYLRIPRRREVFLVHHGQEPLRNVAKEAGVTDIALEASAKQEANAASEIALALGARRLDFTIDEQGVSASNGEPLREITVDRAEALARSPEVGPKIRAKLRAGVAALRHGVSRVRIGDPSSLTKDQATTLIPDASMPVEARENPPRDAASKTAEAAAAPQPPLVLARRSRQGRPRAAGLAKAIRYSRRSGRSEVGVPLEEPHMHAV